MQEKYDDKAVEEVFSTADSLPHGIISPHLSGGAGPETGKMIEALMNNMMGLKEAYQEKADAQLREWKERIERIKTRPGVTLRSGAPSHASEPQRALERLDDCCRIAQVRLEELRSSREERWELAKQAVERAMIDLKRALDESGAAQATSVVRLQSSRNHVYEPFPLRKG